MNTYIEILGQEYLVEYNYEITSEGCPAQISGPPENCYPAESMEFDLFDITLWTTKWVESPPHTKKIGKWEKDTQLVVPGWLETLITEHLFESDKVYEDIEADSEDYYDA